nr:carboxyl transferase domain-containing protein [bacterium]
MARLHRMQERLQAGEDAASAEKRRGEGRLSARERVLQLLDEQSFIETDCYVSSDEEAGLGEGVITGSGTIGGRLVHVAAQDASYLSGAMGIRQAKKIARAMDAALTMGTPFISLMDSAGIRLGEGVEALDAYGMLLQKRASLSGVVPQISVIMGPCAGGMSFFPAMGDIVVQVESAGARLASAGTQVLAAAGGASQDKVGGADMNATKTGLATITAKSDPQALQKVREILAYLPDNNLDGALYIANEDNLNRMIPELDALCEGVSYTDVREVIAAVVDMNAFVELSERYAPSVLTALARLGGHVVGIVATQKNAGKLDGEACNKAARFIRLLDCFHIPVVTLVDCEGFVVDAGQEE